MQGPFLDICFKNNTKNQRGNLLNGEYIYGLHFQRDGVRIKDKLFVYILAGRVYLPMSVQGILDCTGHTIGGQNKDAKFVAESFFDPMNKLDPEKKLVDLHMFD